MVIFIEGVSGVGKTTMIRLLSEELKESGYSVKSYLEFDYTNPIDFYSTAYYSNKDYEKLCMEFKHFIKTIKDNTIVADDVRLIRYYNKNIPLFDEPLLSKLVQREFCYKPDNLIPLEQYTGTYKTIWKNYSLNIDKTYDFIIFDGSLFHHPINDMMRNYCVNDEQAFVHINALLSCMVNIPYRIFYIKSDNIEEQLKKAHIFRKQSIPTKEEIIFWEERFRKDMSILCKLDCNYRIYDISNNKWDMVRKNIFHILTN